jgi:hypothetical protein
MHAIPTYDRHAPWPASAPIGAGRQSARKRSRAQDLTGTVRDVVLRAALVFRPEERSRQHAVENRPTTASSPGRLARAVAAGLLTVLLLAGCSITVAATAPGRRTSYVSEGR